MTANDLVSAALVPVIAGALLWLGGGAFGPRIGPGWADLIQGLAVFVAMIWIAVAAVRRAGAKRGP